MMFAFSVQTYAQCDYMIEYAQNPNNPLEVDLFIMGGAQDSSEVAVWDLGDGNSATGMYVTHQYPNYGTFTVVATIQSNECGTITTTSEIVIDTVNNPTCDLMFDYYVEDDLVVTFNGFGFGYEQADAWEWNFGDSSTVTGQTVTYQFPAEGEYMVTMSATNATCGSMSITQPVFVYLDTMNNCFIDFYFEPMEDMNVFFFAYGDGFSEMDSIFWSFGDGSYGFGMEEVHQYNQAGLYTVSVTAYTNDCGTLSATYDIFIDDFNPNFGCDAYFWYDMDPVDNYSVYFYPFMADTVSSATYFWDFGDGTTSNSVYPYHTFNSDGDYVVTLTIEGDSCTATYSEFVWVGDNSNWQPDECQALFFADYMFDSYEVNFFDLSWEAGSPILSWQWNFGDSTFSAEQNPTHIYNAPGEYFVTLTIITETCSSTFEEVVFVYDNTYGFDCQTFFFPVFDNSLTVEFFDLTMPEATSWTWDFGDGTTSYEPNPIYTYSDTGMYVVTLETMSADSCVSAFAMEIYLFEDPANGKDINYSGEIIRAYALTENTTAIENVNDNVNISVYPNPVTDILNVNFGYLTNNTTVRIIDISGQVLYSQTVTNQTESSINVDNFNNGIYLLQIIENNQVQSVKFIK